MFSYILRLRRSAKILLLRSALTSTRALTVKIYVDAASHSQGFNFEIMIILTRNRCLVYLVVISVFSRWTCTCELSSLGDSLPPPPPQLWRIVRARRHSFMPALCWCLGSPFCGSAAYIAQRHAPFMSRQAQFSGGDPSFMMIQWHNSFQTIAGSWNQFLSIFYLGSRI